ncbi:M20/M25/M40 family metallo-hydrolase [Campylobacter troglodytis]|uniref:M20/M25/M40 family metallo-hydrolase n=1 Tax=Campylobacter troglodytis TaxID=654363 RepID=UPI00115B25DA|nr:M20/M25/M40 family metallo-hydrolase [Campylobacter troglodytis]TQR60958.1 aminoacyl-histidine dipeptidase [Campylobacter troglodytis]
MNELVENFKTLSQIPHCSFDTALMRDFLSKFSKEQGFKTSIDKIGNIHCVKGKPTVCLQSHYDMVCMGEAPKIELFEEDGFLRANNSSLGADNGIGVAIMMQMMKEFENLECLFTNDEEVGLLGANALEHTLLSKQLLNLDHELENEVVIGCAGGVDIRAVKKPHYEEGFGRVYELEALNFKGGHSGIDIIKDTPNAIKEMANFITKNEGVVIEFKGGERLNSIAKYANALVFFKKEPNKTENIACKFIGEKRAFFCKESKEILAAINAFSQGVRGYDQKLGIVKASINLSLLSWDEKDISLDLYARANTLDALQRLEFETRTLFESFNFDLSSSNFYAPWEGEENEFSQKVLNALKSKFEDARILAVHAGLECGIIEKKQELLCASIGPNIFNPHSTDERCELASVAKIGEVVRLILQEA